MRIALHVQSGPAAGRRIVFRAGQTASFGRTDWSDYAYPDDRTMADVHFELHFDGQGCLLRGLAANAQTLVNGQVVEQAVLKHGDLILAGQSTFQVLMDNAAFETAIPLASAVALAATPDKVEDLPKLARQFGLSPEGIVVVKQCTLGKEVPDKLLQAELVIDAVRWQAHRLPKQQSVAWGCACAKGLPNLASLTEEQQAAIAAAEAWSV
ncbi:MAG: FHA domain-containing protein, partial [Pirellulaceae bacterium]|nr:FHA domain-containing protein [Pirellulaceae bacterium]